MKKKNTDLAWFAGFYEGEGWISNDKSNNNRIRIGMAQNDIAPLKEGQLIWGGTVRKRVRKSPASNKICICHEWILYTKEARKFLKDTVPYMRIPRKINQIHEAILLQKEGLDRKFKCGVCEMEFANPSGRRRHQKKEHEMPGKVFSCGSCERTYKSNDSLVRHKRINHKKIEIKTC